MGGELLTTEGHLIFFFSIIYMLNSVEYFEGQVFVVAFLIEE